MCIPMTVLLIVFGDGGLKNPHLVIYDLVINDRAAFGWLLGEGGSAIRVLFALRVVC